MQRLARSHPNRRQAIGAAAALAAVALIRPASAAADEMREAVKAWTKGAVVKPGLIRLDVPALVENGNSVSVSVSVEGPFTESYFVKSIAVFNEKNPQPQVAVFHLGPRSGRADVATRIRLADSQIITAVALMSDGRYWSDSAEVIVTLAACIET